MSMEMREPVNVTQRLYTLYDSKADAFQFPWPARNDSTAIRQVLARCMNTDNDLYKFGADYTLFYVGEFEDNTCTINTEPALKSLGTALQIFQAGEAEYNANV